MRIVVLDSFAADQGESDAWRELGASGEVVVYPRTVVSEVIARCQGAGALVVNKVVIGRDAMSALPALRYVGLTATGVNVVDLDAARAHGVAVTNVPDYASDSVAQHAFALILDLALDLAGHSAAVKAGRWASSPNFCFLLRPTPELSGKTLVIVGLGSIGRTVARIAGAFGMNVVAAAVPGSPTREPRVPLAEALPAADVVSLHCPLTDATAALVSRDFLSRLNPGALLVNTSRGRLIDEPALIDALATGHLGGVGLDVLADEPPPPSHPLTDPAAPWAARVLVTPHMAWATTQARARVRHEAAENLAAFLRGERRNRVD